MKLRPLRAGVSGVVIGILTFGASVRAEDTRETSRSAPSSSSTSPQSRTGSSAGRTSTARGILPDPILLDGSGQPAEKRPENGMLGDFEMPGDENVRNGKVGGPMPPPNGGNQSAGAQSQMPAGMPAGASGGGAESAQNQAAQAAAAGGGGAQSANQSQAQGGGGAPGGPTDPNGAAGGMQVGQLETDASAGGAGAHDGAQQKPQQMAIGDKAMQIKTVPNAPGVVGGQVPAGNTQQMESAVGGKGGGGSSSRSGGNAAEKGRAMPAGL